MSEHDDWLGEVKLNNILQLQKQLFLSEDCKLFEAYVFKVNGRLLDSDGAMRKHSQEYRYEWDPMRFELFWYPGAQAWIHSETILRSPRSDSVS